MHPPAGSTPGCVHPPPPVHPPTHPAPSPLPPPQGERLDAAAGVGGGVADLEAVRVRIKDTVAVLDNFAKLRAKGRSRADYMQQVCGRAGGWAGNSVGAA